MAPIVYGLCRPDGRVRYIGQTTNGRRRLHTHRMLAKKGSHLPVHKWMKKHRDVDMVVLIDNAVWNEDEVRLIKEARDRGEKLLNCTDGGDGQIGTKLSDAHKRKIASSLHMLDERDLKAIEAMKLKGLSYRQIGRQLGVSHNTARNAVIGRTYAAG